MILTAACILALVLVAYLANRRVEKAIYEMRAETEAREAALNKQAKVFVRKLAVTERAAAKTVDASRATVDEARSLNLNTQQFFQDRRVQRLLNREGGE